MFVRVLDAAARKPKARASQPQALMVKVYHRGSSIHNDAIQRASNALTGHDNLEALVFASEKVGSRHLDLVKLDVSRP